MSLWQQYGHLWPQALIVSLTVVNVCWNLVMLFNQARAARGKPLVEMAASLTVSLVSAAVYLALDTQRIAAVLRPSLTRAKVAYYLWITERVIGAAIFAGLVVMSMNDPELQKKISESSKKQGPTLWRVLLMFTPFILGFALWKMNRNLVSTERRERQQRQLQQQQQQQQQGAVAQNSNAAGNQQRQPTRMRRWPAVFEAFCAALSFGSVCYRFAIMSLPVLYMDVSFGLFTLYVQAFGLMAIYRRSIPSIQQYSYLLVIAVQESQILNLDLDSILNAKPTDKASFTDLLSAEMSLVEYSMSAILSVAFDVWMCRKMVQDLEKIEAESVQAQAQIQAQLQTQEHIQAHIQTQEAATRASTSERQALHEKQD
ncbi:hypothetical protein BG000_003846 [Podila horticola]|nr:hypothetical protein BG000_003846 [Podila horticola]